MDLIGEALCLYLTLITNGFGFSSILSVPCGLVLVSVFTYSDKNEFELCYGTRLMLHISRCIGWHS